MTDITDAHREAFDAAAEEALDPYDPWRDAIIAAVLAVKPTEPLLGLATTTQLIEELSVRAEVSATIGEAWPSYRTVDGR